jgi:hypothetical protein
MSDYLFIVHSFILFLFDEYTNAKSCKIVVECTLFFIKEDVHVIDAVHCLLSLAGLVISPIYRESEYELPHII